MKRYQSRSDKTLSFFILNSICWRPAGVPEVEVSAATHAADDASGMACCDTNRKQWAVRGIRLWVENDSLKTAQHRFHASWHYTVILIQSCVLIFQAGSHYWEKWVMRYFSIQKMFKYSQWMSLRGNCCLFCFRSSQSDKGSSWCSSHHGGQGMRVSQLHRDTFRHRHMQSKCCGITVISHWWFHIFLVFVSDMLHRWWTISRGLLVEEWQGDSWPEPVHHQ